LSLSQGTQLVEKKDLMERRGKMKSGKGGELRPPKKEELLGDVNFWKSRLPRESLREKLSCMGTTFRFLENLWNPKSVREKKQSKSMRTGRERKQKSKDMRKGNKGYKWSKHRKRAPMDRRKS